MAFVGNDLDFLTLLHLGSYNYDDDNSTLRHTGGKLEEVLISHCYFGSIKFLLNFCNCPLCSCHFKSGSADWALVSAVHRPEIDGKSRGGGVWRSVPGENCSRLNVRGLVHLRLHISCTFLSTIDQKSLLWNLYFCCFFIKHALLLILHAFLHLGVQTIRTRLCFPMPSFCSDSWIIWIIPSFLPEIPKLKQKHSHDTNSIPFNTLMFWFDLTENYTLPSGIQLISK